MESLVCIGVCLGLTVFNEDIVSEAASNFRVAEAASNVVSRVHEVSFRNPNNGEDLTDSLKETLAAVDSPLKVFIPLNTSEFKRTTEELLRRHEESLEGVDEFGQRKKRETSNLQPGIECRVFDEGTEEWDPSSCEPNPTLTNMADGSVIVDCDCAQAGAIAVFAILTDSVVIMVPEVFVYEKDVKFRIDADYDALVAPDEDAFLDVVRKRLAELLTTTENNIKELNAESGSIIITFKLVGYDDEEADQLETAYEELAKLFEEGRVTMDDVDGNSMSIPPQCLDSCSKRTETDDKVALILIIAAVSVVVLVILIIVIAVCIKKRKGKDKVKPLLDSRGSQQPTYKSMPFADSMEGTKGSVNRQKRGNRSPGNIPPYMPGPDNYNSIMRRQSKSSVILSEESDSGVFIERKKEQYYDEDGIPRDRARYRTPSREDLEKTQPISEEMRERVQKKMTRSLPGSPNDYDRY